MPRSITGCFAQQNIGEVSVGRKGYKNENKTANDSPSHAIVSTGQCTITNHKKSQEKLPSKRKMQGDTYPAFAHVRTFPIGQSPYIIYPQNGKYIIETYTTYRAFYPFRYYPSGIRINLYYTVDYSSCSNYRTNL